MEFVDNLSISCPIFCTEIDDHIIFLDKPSKLDNIPKIDISFNEKYIQICDDAAIEKYFNLLTDDEFRPAVFNGIYLEFENGSTMGCDYCHTYIEEDGYYCYHCYSDMCDVCYDNPDLLTDINYTYEKYKTNVSRCKECNKIKPRSIHHIKNFTKYCDICSDIIHISDNRYTKAISSLNSFDICMKCYNNDEACKNIVKEKEMKLDTINTTDRSRFLFNYTDFNSLLYWVPIITDGKWSYILINLNPDDKNYGKLCLQSCDDNGRSGYFIIYDETVTLDVLLKKLKEITDKETFDYSSSAIQFLMKQFNMPIYYG